MALEIWILLALVVVILGVAAVGRLRRPTRRAVAESERNVYPLW